jgi:hypothetical protein
VIAKSYRQAIKNGCGKKSNRAKQHGRFGKGGKSPAGKHKLASKTRADAVGRAGLLLGR